MIYERLPKGVLQELKSKTPKSPSGNYSARFFQSLTEDIGNPHLQAQLSSIITLFQISDDWRHFLSQFNKLIDRQKGQLELNFEDLYPAIETKKNENPTPLDKPLNGISNVHHPKISNNEEDGFEYTVVIEKTKVKKTRKQAVIKPNSPRLVTPEKKE